MSLKSSRSHPFPSRSRNASRAVPGTPLSPEGERHVTGRRLFAGITETFPFPKAGTGTIDHER
jgi:hypothetical protein